MPRLTPTTALGGTAPWIDEIGGLRIAEIAEPCLVAMAVRAKKNAAFTTAAKTAFGVDLPAPNTASMTDRHAVIWMGPDQYLVEANSADASLAGKMADSFGSTASLTDASDAWARFDVTGSDSIAMLERLSAADSRGMTAGKATRTPIHHMACLILCREAGASFSVYGPRSSASSLHHALVTAAAAL